MFINPKVAIEKGWITGIKDPAKQVQPNAIDFTLDKVMTLNTDVTPFIGESRKVMRPLYENLPVKGFPDQWLLMGGRVYDGMSDVYVNVPEGVAAVLFTRSTFARNGVFIQSGLYDSGFIGHVGFTIYTVGGQIAIETGTRIGQIAFFNAENAGLYGGQYSHEQGASLLLNVVEQAVVASQRKLEQPNATFGGHNIIEPAQERRVEPAPQPPKSDMAKDLEEKHKWNSDHHGVVAGTKSYL